MTVKFSFSSSTAYLAITISRAAFVVPYAAMVGMRNLKTMSGLLPWVLMMTIFLATPFLRIGRNAFTECMTPKTLTLNWPQCEVSLRTWKQ